MNNQGMTTHILVLTLLLVTAFTSGCGVVIVKGSGNLRTQDYDVSGYNSLEIEVPIVLYLEQGNDESCTIEGDDNILAMIGVDVTDGVLRIGLLEPGNVTFRPTKEITARITIRRIVNIGISGAAKLHANDIQAETLGLDVSGAVKGEITNLSADALQIHVSGAGDITVSGAVESQELHISGAGKYIAKDLKSNNCDVDISGSGEAVVNVAENLNVNVSGAGKVRYIGDPAISRTISGFGNVTKYLD